MYLFDDFILSPVNINRKAFLCQIRFERRIFVITTVIVIDGSKVFVEKMEKRCLGRDYRTLLRTKTKQSSVLCIHLDLLSWRASMKGTIAHHNEQNVTVPLCDGD